MKLISRVGDPVRQWWVFGFRFTLPQPWSFSLTFEVFNYGIFIRCRLRPFHLRYIGIGNYMKNSTHWREYSNPWPQSRA